MVKEDKTHYELQKTQILKLQIRNTSQSPKKGYTISAEILADLATDEEVLQIRNIAAAIARRAAERGYTTA